ncbi:MAG: type II toxin-antitoxin system prevent-host-death family antitoxin [Acidobacteria bacterium]|nr:type II toxin-antitoxin system prevent-host-death family antitoxin [Acidobacteriota bacterium]
MRFVSVRELRGQSAAVWRALAEEKELVVTSNGKPIAVLSATSDEHLEESLQSLRRARAQAAVAAIQQASRDAGTDRLSLDEIDAEIDAVRRSRSRSR